MKPMVLMPSFFMCCTMACAITSLPWGRRNSHSSWPGGTPTGEAAICRVLPSAATGAIAAATGVSVEPRITSTWSSVIRRRVLLTPLPGSEASSSTIRFTFSPPICLGNCCSCFCMGMPRPEPGPVSERMTPTLTSASAAPAESAIAVATRVRASFIACCLRWLKTSARRHAQRAIQADHFAVEVAVGHDVAGELGELLRLAQALRERDGLRQRFLHLLGQLLHQRRGEQAGCDGADADAVLREVARHGQGHAHQPALGGAVGLLAHLAVECGNRRGEQHDATLVVVQRRQPGAFGGEQARHVVRAYQVDVHDAREVCQRRRAAVLLDDTFGAADAGDVHHDARGAVLFGGAGDGVRHALRIGDVALDRNAADVPGDLFGLGRVHVQHGDLGAQAREFARGGFAQPGGAAGDERGLSLDLHAFSFCGFRVKGRRSSCKACTSASRCFNTARWLMEPLSVTSPLSMEGASSIRCRRATRLALPVACFARAFTTSWKWSCTAALSSTCFSGASAARCGASWRILVVGKTSAPTSLRFRPVITTSCT